jgi:Fur family ferric uptake transcriptional regulator
MPREWCHLDRGAARIGIGAEMQREPITTVAISESPVEKFREFLEIRGEKLTEPRRVLVRHIFNSHKHFDADELVRDLHDAGHHVSRSTGYRTLRLLVEAGLLRELRLTNRSAFEHDYGYPTHDHLHCTSCNRIVEFRNDEILKLRDSVSLVHGFRPSGHRFLISGICSACSRSHTPRRRLDLI